MFVYNGPIMAIGRLKMNMARSEIRKTTSKIIIPNILFVIELPYPVISTFILY